MKHLKKFKSLADANTQGIAGLDSPHVDIISGLGIVNYMDVAAPTFKAEFDSEGHIMLSHCVGDIAYWDGSGISFTPYTLWNSSLGTPIGVCFIPTSHAKAWGDGKARFLSVKGVTTGGTASSQDISMVWGPASIDTSLTNFGNVPTWTNTPGTTTTGSNYYGYIPSDRFRGTLNVIDTAAGYFSATNMIPSPYAVDGGFNTDYNVTQIGGSSITNALSDFNGKSNTQILVGLGTNYEAANACAHYSTSGTSQGDWYLPAMGELTYIMPRFNVIRAALSACGGVLLDYNRIYQSSTECSKTSVYHVRTQYSDANKWHKANSYYVRPVISLS